ncbi:MAG: hypothetical protein P1U70_16065 [Saprospiraceae bacterium]|nr:hypothetical protein [Saprospiraceae bacterium]
MKCFWLICLFLIFIYPNRLQSDNTAISYFEPFLQDSKPELNINEYFLLENLVELSQYDTITPPETYMGYRLHLTQIKVLKKSENWIRIQFSAINTGRNHINFSKKGTAHWIQFQFDNSLYDSKLGGWKEQIRYAFYNSNFKLKAGKMTKEAELKVEMMIPVISHKTIEKKPIASPKEPAQKIIFTTGGSNDFTEKELLNSKIQCPDLIIESLQVVNQSKKWATIEYTLANIGKGPVDLVERVGNEPIKLAIRAHISGVPTLSKGALSIGGGFVGENINSKDITLYPNDRYKETVKLDIRKKTRYLKTIILSLDTHSLSYECDRTNNTNAIELQ